MRRQKAADAAGSFWGVEIDDWVEGAESRQNGTKDENPYASYVVEEESIRPRFRSCMANGVSARVLVDSGWTWTCAAQISEYGRSLVGSMS